MITALDIQLGHCRGVISSSTSSLNTLKSRSQQSEKVYQSNFIVKFIEYFIFIVNYVIKYDGLCNRDITEQKNQISMKNEMNNLLTIYKKNLNDSKIIELKLMTELKQLNIEKNQLDVKLRIELVNAERNMQETEEEKELLMSAIDKCRTDFDQV